MRAVKEKYRGGERGEGGKGGVGGKQEEEKNTGNNCNQQQKVYYSPGDKMDDRSRNRLCTA